MNPTRQTPCADFSPAVLAAYADLGCNLDLLERLTKTCLATSACLSPDDFLAKKADGLREPVRLFLEPYSDEEDYASRGIPLTGPGDRKTMLAHAAVAAMLLWLRGHKEVGVALVDSTGRGHILKQLTIEDMVSREVQELRLAGGAS